MKKLDELFNIDREFCKLSQSNKQQAWLKYLSKDAKMGTRLHEPYIEGKKRISKVLEILYSLPSLDFTWEPQVGYISDDSSLGFTSGIYTRIYKLEGETVIEKGKYITVWKKEEDTWKIIFDMGN